MAGALIDYARDNPDRLAVSDGVSQLTHATLNARVNRVIDLLRRSGVDNGDRVAIMAQNCTDFLVISLAAHLSGVSQIPVNWHFTAGEAAYLIGDAGAKALFVGPAEAETGNTAAGIAGCGLVVGIGDDLDVRLLECSPAEPTDEMFFASAIFYTSGTTGRPKATRLSQQPTNVPVADAIEGIRGRALLSNLGEEAIHLVQGPMYHAGPQNNAATTALLGGEVHIMRRFDAEDVLRHIDAHKVSHTMMVPTMFVRLDRLPDDVKRKYDVSSLAEVPHIAAPMPMDVKRRMIDWWGPVLMDAYGASEIGVITRISSQEWLERPGSVGKPIDAFTIQIVGEDGEDLPTGEVGMIYMTSLTAVDLEYLGDPEKTAAAHRADKQFTLGDMGWLDADGYLFLADRRVDLIISGGVNIYPAEIEMALLAHPAVEDVAVFGIPSEEWGQEVKAAIQTRPGHDGSDDLATEILEWLGERVARYKVPRSVDFHDQLPRYSNGKLHRRVLRDAYWPEARSA